MDIITFLIECGADINCTDKWNETPLFRAIRIFNNSSLLTLIKGGADIHHKNIAGQEPLHVAAFLENVPALKVLVASGCDANTKTDYGDSALHLAASRGQNLAIEYLLDQGADVNCRGRMSRTPLQIAMLREGSSDTVRILLSRGARTDVADGSALHLAAEAGNTNVVEYLLEVGANVNSIDQFLRTPVQLAMMGNHHEIVNILMRSGAWTDVRDRYKHLPFTYSKDK